MSTTFEINYVVHFSAAVVVANPTVRKYTHNLNSANWLKMVKFTKENINMLLEISIYNYLWKSYNNQN